MPEQQSLGHTIPHRFCEFVEIDEKGEYIGAMRNSEAWEGACQRPAEHIFKFDNHNAYLCQKHWDRMFKWLEETW